MPQYTLVLLPLALCALCMGGMMWMMMRHKDHSAHQNAVDPAPRDTLTAAEPAPREAPMVAGNPGVASGSEPG
jgi:hypothetical protein